MSSGECCHELKLRRFIKCNRQSLVIFVYPSHVNCVTHHAKEQVRGDLFLDEYTHRVKVTDQALDRLFIRSSLVNGLTPVILEERLAAKETTTSRVPLHFYRTARFRNEIPCMVCWFLEFILVKFDRRT